MRSTFMERGTERDKRETGGRNYLLIQSESSCIGDLTPEHMADDIVAREFGTVIGLCERAPSVIDKTDAVLRVDFVPYIGVAGRTSGTHRTAQARLRALRLDILCCFGKIFFRQKVVIRIVGMKLGLHIRQHTL